MAPETNSFELAPAEASERRAGGRAILLDVREGFERDLASIEGAVWIPMGEIVSRAGELSRDGEVIVFCHHGARSAQVAMYLQRSGYPNVRNLAGGIDAWSIEVDPKIPRY
jgi:sulfur-carrier protein adenylyltransferase/sulfurtransferase